MQKYHIYTQKPRLANKTQKQREQTRLATCGNMGLWRKQDKNRVGVSVEILKKKKQEEIALNKLIIISSDKKDQGLLISD